MPLQGDQREIAMEREVRVAPIKVRGSDTGNASWGMEGKERNKSDGRELNSKSKRIKKTENRRGQNSCIPETTNKTKNTMLQPS